MNQNKNFLGKIDQNQQRLGEKPKLLRSINSLNTSTRNLSKETSIGESKVQGDKSASSCSHVFEPKQFWEVASVLHPSNQKTFYSLPVGSETGFVYKIDLQSELNWILTKQLSSGLNREVFLVTNSKTSSIGHLVIKKLSCVSKSQRLASYAFKGFQQEIRVLCSLRHRGIVHLINYYLSPLNGFLAESFYEGGDLYECTKYFYTDFSPEFVGRIFAEIVHAVAYLHDQLLVHRDLKLENILLTKKYEDLREVKGLQFYQLPLIKVSDFEFSKFVDKESHIVQSECGSQEYSAPEIYMGLAHDGFKADCWSLGILLFSMIEGRLPFDAIPPFEDPPDIRIKRYVQRLVRLTYNWIRCKPPKKQEHELSDNSASYSLDLWIEARDLVQSLLVHRDHRPYSQEILKNSWIRNSFSCNS
ncbi:CAMK protein kinase Ppk27 [Schizosaccharomyces cryophilus OY26]|uniref:CAMK protein kinase Ppk27 n=1 Tax=Schizosaccharomyces cryophilus (strain OY26 / ATCC MYA-4695 / CBS 11777 / NBRC 106824 / NRRL Y48691) TaxID=653667 RepID=S9VTF9_SCHCR|nr:CAMK protein kinase Ppk27 [Schizosaccharomyces cryophilus OY26]EPY49424.1 CAMK protein kinase Ppk27 [Schizosaccharomyces cryophilus OY26]